MIHMRVLKFEYIVYTDLDGSFFLGGGGGGVGRKIIKRIGRGVVDM